MGQAASALEVSEDCDLFGKVAIITGASSGIGKEVAKVLLLRGARVVIPVRSVDKGEAVKKELQDEFSAATRGVLASNCIALFKVPLALAHPSTSYLTHGFAVRPLVPRLRQNVCH
jgi:NAD(P)-dependent dehydrogenase (short-subunit alcohol dehydrogenase family)